MQKLTLAPTPGPDGGRRPRSTTRATPTSLIGVAAALVAVTSACGSSSSSKSATASTTAAPTANSVAASAAAGSSGGVDLSKVTLNVGEEEKNVVTLLTQAGLQNTPYKIVYSERLHLRQNKGRTWRGRCGTSGPQAPTINAIAAGAPSGLPSPRRPTT